MKPPAFLRTLSIRIPSSLSSSPVAPLPVRTAFDRWLATELAALRCSTHPSASYTAAAWMARALDVAIAAQKTSIESIVRARGCDHKAAIDAYLEDVVELLDTCNGLRERMEGVRKYVESSRVAAHSLSVGCGLPNEAAFARAEAALGTCRAMERRCAELDKCGSSLRKLGEKLAAQCSAICMGRENGEMGADAREVDEALSGSKAMALLVCGMLSIAVSFKTKRGLHVSQCSWKDGSWSSLLHELQKEAKEEIDKRRKDGVVLDEMQEVMEAAQRLKGLISQRREKEVGRREVRACVGELERSCGALEGWMKMFEEKVNQMYREMISVRMCLLRLASSL